MPVCMCHFECCCLFAWGIFSWHVSCAVKAYCAWVITCHCKPRALLAPQSRRRRCFCIALPLFVCLSNPCQPFFPSFVFLLSLCFSFFVHLCILPEKWYQALEADVFFDRFILLYLFFHFIFAKGIQPCNNQSRSSWNSCQAWLRHPFVRHVTTGSRGCADDDRSAGSLPPRGPRITAWQTAWYF